MPGNEEIKRQLAGLFSELPNLPAAQESLPPISRAVTEDDAARQIGSQPALFRTLVENALDAIFISDLEGYQTYSNSVCYRLFGYDSEKQEMNGLPLTSIWFDDDLSILRGQLLPQTLSGGWSGRARQRRKDGTTFEADLTAFPVLDGDGEPTSIAIIVREIMERGKPEREKSAAYEHRVFQIQLAAGLAQEIVSAPTLDELYHRAVTLVKERFGYYHVQVFHYIPKLNALVRVKSYPRADGEAATAGRRLPYGAGVVGAAAAVGKPILVPDLSQNPDWTRPAGFPAAEGELAVPIRLRNRVSGVLDVLSDTAGALTREDEIVLLDLVSRIAGAIGDAPLLEEADVLHQFAQARVGIGWITLENNVIAYMNPALCAILGVDDPNAALGKPIVSCYPQHLWERLENEILPDAILKGQWDGELELISSQGVTIPVVQSFFLVRDEDERPRHLATVVTDITAQQSSMLLLNKYTRELEFLNDIGLKMHESLQPAQFMRWLAGRLPTVMRHSEVCVAAIEFEGQVYGAASTLTLPRRIAAEIVLGGQTAGRIHVAYTEEREFLSEEETLLGDIARRASNYVESNRLFEQTQAVLEEIKASHRLYLPKQWVGRMSGQETSLVHSPLTPRPHVQSNRARAILHAFWKRITS